MAGEVGFYEVAGELYALPPERFIAARDERVRAAREAGDRALATELGRLRRPTASAWAVNLLARDQPDLVDQLLALGEDLRAAQAELRGEALRELASQRQRVVAELVKVARKRAAEEGHPVSADIGYEVEQTLHAALTDPAVAREVCAGRLVHAVERTGFGTGSAEAAPAPAGRPAPGPSQPAPRRDGETAAERRERERAERGAAERERLRAAREQAAADLEAANADLDTAEDRLTAAERAQQEATALVDSLEEQLNAARHAIRDTGRAVLDARRRRDAASRARDSVTRQLTDLDAKLAARR